MKIAGILNSDNYMEFSLREFFCVAENGFGRGNYDNQGVWEITVLSLSKYGSGSIEYSEKWQDSLRGGVQPLPEKEGDSNCNQS